MGMISNSPVGLGIGTEVRARGHEGSRRSI